MSKRRKLALRGSPRAHDAFGYLCKSQVHSAHAYAPHSNTGALGLLGLGVVDGRQVVLVLVRDRAPRLLGEKSGSGQLWDHATDQPPQWFRHFISAHHAPPSPPSPPWLGGLPSQCNGCWQGSQ